MSLKNLKTILRKSIHQSYFLVALYLGIISGSILALIFRINYFASPLWLTFAILLLIITYFKPKLTFITLALLAGFIMAFFRVATELKGESYLKKFMDQEIILTGTVSGDPNPDQEKSTLKFKLTNLAIRNREEDDLTEAPGSSTETSSSLTEIAGSVYITAKDNLAISRSDRLTLKGKLQKGFGTYAGYFYQPTIQEIKHPNPPDPILTIRNWFADRIKSSLPEQEANLGLSYLLGMKTNLDPKLDENLRTVGLVHMVVASGTHLSILVGVARKIFGKISRFSGLLFAAIFILAFMSMVGFTPSILRAGLMSLLTLLAWFFGHQFAPWRIILMVAAITLLINPMFLLDLGWLLSFASYAGIMFVSPKLTRFFYGRKKPKFIAETVIATISATLTTLPITLYNFGQISLLSLAANVLLLPTLPLALGLTFAAGLTANLFLSPVVSILTSKLLEFHIHTVAFFAAQTNFLVQTEIYNPIFFALYGFIVTPLIIGLFRQKMVKSKQITIQNNITGEKYVRT